MPGFFLLIYFGLVLILATHIPASYPSWLLQLIPRNKFLQTSQTSLVLFFLSNIVSQFALRLRLPFRQHTCCLSPDFAFWSESLLTKEEKKKLKKRGRQKKGSLSNALHWTMNFPHHSNVSAECLSDSLQQILKCDNGPQKWVMVSFCWFHFPDLPYPPGLCTSIN